MSNTFKRLTIAACLSISGIIGTLVWERMTTEKSGLQSVGEPVAQLMTVVRDVERKPSQRLIWERISEGSQLFAGETIRTARDSEAHVEFIRSKTRIDLDPDSEIVIQEVDGKIELNFLKGNLFVASTGNQAGEAGGTGLTLKSGDKNIALGGAELTLSQNGKGKLDVTVLKGDASLGSAAQIKILSPAPNETVYVIPKDKTPIAFSYEAIPAGYRLSLEAGASRDEMKPITADVSAAGRVQAAMKLGRVYWRLVAKPNTVGQPELASAVFKMNVHAKTPAVLLTPEREDVIALSDYADGVPLTWSNPARLDRLQLEIFSDKNPAKALIVQEVDGDEFLAKSLQPGNYTWRITGRLPGKDEAVTSSLRPFRTIAQRDLAVPVLVSPRMDELVPFQSFNEKGLELRWKPVPGAVAYKVSVKNRKSNETVEKQAASPLFLLRDLKPGDYSWSVQAIGAKELQSKPSSLNTFGLAELLELKWADGKIDSEQKYFTDAPSIALTWEKGPESAAKYRLRVKAERDVAAGAASDWNVTDKVSATQGVAADGIYFAEVEALDIKGQVVARSPRRRIAIAPEPLLPAPVFDVSLGADVVASGAGAARFAWSAVNGAKEYEIRYDGSGKVNEVRLAETEKSLTKLMPGKYTVTVRAVDTHGRRGLASLPKTMTVPDKSDVRAPKLKKFRFD